MRYTLLQIARKDMGLCIDCGAELPQIDVSAGCVRCAVCRAKHRSGYMYSASPAAATAGLQAQSEAPGKPKSKKQQTPAPRSGVPEECQQCPWSTYIGDGKWFCPTPYCNKKFNPRAGETENPLGTTVKEVIAGAYC